MAWFFAQFICVSPNVTPTRVGGHEASMTGSQSGSAKKEQDTKGDKKTDFNATGGWKTTESESDLQTAIDFQIDPTINWASGFGNEKILQRACSFFVIEIAPWNYHAPLNRREI